MQQCWLFAKLSVLSTALFAILIILTAIMTGWMYFEFGVDALEFYGIMFLAFWVYSLPVGLIHAGLTVFCKWQKSLKSVCLSATTLGVIAFLVMIGIQWGNGFTTWTNAEWQVIITIVLVAGVVGAVTTVLLPKPI
ncbi:hypothetical protein [Moraxella oblonga]|uniref:hypothetical protein n=1 Tax=Moraxella oblonga TaxID=200413 RepID=UPI00082D869B|nr:hypothetical protein [Moraxella oblonga]